MRGLLFDLHHILALHTLYFVLFVTSRRLVHPANWKTFNTLTDGIQVYYALQLK